MVTLRPETYIRHKFKSVRIWSHPEMERLATNPERSPKTGRIFGPSLHSLIFGEEGLATKHKVIDPGIEEGQVRFELARIRSLSHHKGKIQRENIREYLEEKLGGPVDIKDEHKAHYESVKKVLEGMQRIESRRPKVFFPRGRQNFHEIFDDVYGEEKFMQVDPEKAEEFGQKLLDKGVPPEVVADLMSRLSAEGPSFNIEDILTYVKDGRLSRDQAQIVLKHLLVDHAEKFETEEEKDKRTLEAQKIKRLAGAGGGTVSARGGGIGEETTKETLWNRIKSNASGILTVAGIGIGMLVLWGFFPFFI